MVVDRTVKRDTKKRHREDREKGDMQSREGVFGQRK